jgi:hypothetical protein
MEEVDIEMYRIIIHQSETTITVYLELFCMLFAHFLPLCCMFDCCFDSLGQHRRRRGGEAC